MSRSNFTVKDENGKTHWISRSVVVVPTTFKIVGNYLYTIVEKRGKVVSNTGKWCCPCGYLDWDESLEEACIREVREETGIEVNPQDIYLIGVNGKPKDEKQDVSLRYFCIVPTNMNYDFSKIETKDEVDLVEWLHVGTFDSPGSLTIHESEINGEKYTWAFNHNELIKDVIIGFYKNSYTIKID